MTNVALGIDWYKRGWVGVLLRPSTAAEVHAGTAVYSRNADDGTWIKVNGGDPGADRRWGTDPLWILEALVFTDRARGDDTDRESVRGEPCRRIRFHVDPASRRSRATARNRGPLKRLLTAMGAALFGEVFVAGDERVRRVGWANTRALRPRSPWAADWSAAPHTWSVVELWDFGADADLDLPPTEPGDTRQRASIPDAVRALPRVVRAARALGRRRGATPMPNTTTAPKNH